MITIVAVAVGIVLGQALTLCIAKYVPNRGRHSDRIDTVQDLPEATRPDIRVVRASAGLTRGIQNVIDRTELDSMPEVRLVRPYIDNEREW